ncbi:MAG: McrC family protein [Magnetococcus sp. YQC-5]
MKKNAITLYEFDVVLSEGAGLGHTEVPATVFAWLEAQCLRMDARAWLKFTRRNGHKAIQVTSFVGVIRTPQGFHIEVLPKVGKVIDDGAKEARQLLLEMLRCLNGFRHIRIESALLAAAKMPLMEVFIGEFLQSVEQVVKRGLRSDYVSRQDNLFVLRGKLLVTQQIRQNVCRADKFYTEHDEFTPNRPENRLLHAALRRVLSESTTPTNQRLARELCFVFAEIPASTQAAQDFQQIRMDRGLAYYADALAWARLILENESPLTGIGHHHAPSLLFPMEMVFEAFVANCLSQQISRSYRLKNTEDYSHYLVGHRDQKWFFLKPDMLITKANNNLFVLDTKWKLLNERLSNSNDKYRLEQNDFYQLFTYGQHHLNGKGDLILIYPKTNHFHESLPVFNFPKAADLRLWVMPFCLQSRRLLVPINAPINECFKTADALCLSAVA